MYFSHAVNDRNHMHMLSEHQLNCCNVSMCKEIACGSSASRIVEREHAFVGCFGSVELGGMVGVVTQEV